jgi:hypothetical protein
LPTAPVLSFVALNPAHSPVFKYVLRVEDVAVGTIVKLLRTAVVIASHTITQTDLDTGICDMAHGPEPIGTWNYTAIVNVSGVDSSPSNTVVVVVT